MVTRSGVQGDVYGKKYSYICRARGNDRFDRI